MGHHLLNGVKCVREARGLTNALIIRRWTGRGEETAGNDKTLSRRHKLPLGGAPETTRSRLAAANAQPDVLSCVQTITGTLDRKKKKESQQH